VRVWYEQTLNAATVLSLEEIGTVRVSYEGMDLEEEVPMAYLFNLTNDGNTTTSSSGTAASAGDKSQRSSIDIKMKPKQKDNLDKMMKFANGDLVEVYVGEDDVMEEKDWLPAMVTSAAVDDGYEVRMLVGYDEEDATFEVEEKEVRKIPVRFGGSMDPKKVKKGSKVRVWYEQTLNAATVLSLEEIGTVRVSYEGMDLEEEVPMAYLFSMRTNQ